MYVIIFLFFKLNKKLSKIIQIFSKNFLVFFFLERKMKVTPSSFIKTDTRARARTFQLCVINMLYMKIICNLDKTKCYFKRKWNFNSIKFGWQPLPIFQKNKKRTKRKENGSSIKRIHELIFSCLSQFCFSYRMIHKFSTYYLSFFSEFN